MTTTLRTATASGGIALLLVLTSCSTGGDVAGASVAAATTTAAAAEASPLDEFFEQMYGEWSEEDGNAQQNQVEEIIATCMREQGFEYIPVDFSPMRIASGEDLDVEWGSKEFAEKYGYGATTDPWGFESAAGESSGDREWFDPNQQSIELMSEPEQRAYLEALYGPPYDESEGDPEEYELNWEMHGCSGKARYEVFDRDGGRDDPRFASLLEEMSIMREAASDDSRMAELDSSWSSCMADAGHPGLAAVGDAEVAILEKVNAVYDSNEPDEDSTDAGWEDLQGTIRAQIAELSEEEIALAVADWQCKDTLRYDAIRHEVASEYQQEFIDAHRTELEAWLAAFDESR